jgi:hypothetical protein
MNTLFLVAMIVEAIFAIGFLAAPGPMMAPFGVTLDTSGASFARLFGSAVLALVVLLWLARKSSNMDFKKGAVTSMFVYYLVSGVIMLQVQLAGLMIASGWGIIGLHTILLACFGYYLLK